MKQLILILTALVLGNTIYAQNPSNYEKDKATLKNLCGCFEVEFKYKETFGYVPKYELTDKYINDALEWVSYEEQPDGSVKMQHILIVDTNVIVKHWREDWVYEGNEYFDYKTTYKWNKIKEDKKDVAGKWLQKVYQVDDRVQYAGVATLNHFDGKVLWQSQVDAPLPRREYTKRKDYNVLNRLNRLYISDTGYLHEQDNFKINRQEGKADQLISEEKGWNTYKKVEESKCQAGINWWNDNKKYWLDVRVVWDKIEAEKQVLDIEWELDSKTLFEHLFTLNKELVDAKKYDSAKAQETIYNTIKPYIK